jgi:predicted nucleotidyltransferase
MEEAIQDALNAKPRIAFALIFGSIVTGRRTGFGDIDVAIGLSAGA